MRPAMVSATPTAVMSTAQRVAGSAGNPVYASDVLGEVLLVVVFAPVVVVVVDATVTGRRVR